MKGSKQGMAEAQALQGEVDRLRQVILGMVRDDFRGLFERTQYLVTTAAESLQWRDSISERIVEMVKPASPRVGYDRMPCPLCGGKTSDYDGYAPEGLARHLKGLYVTKRCPVLDVAHAVAQQVWSRDPDFRSAIRYKLAHLRKHKEEITELHGRGLITKQNLDHELAETDREMIELEARLGK